MLQGGRCCQAVCAGEEGQLAARCCCSITLSQLVPAIPPLPSPALHSSIPTRGRPTASPPPHGSSNKNPTHLRRALPQRVPLEPSHEPAHKLLVELCFEDLDRLDVLEREGEVGGVAAGLGRAGEEVLRD